VRVLGRHRVAFAVCLGLAACSGARHRRVAGPPPEYERPDDPVAGPSTGAGTGGHSDAGIIVEPTPPSHESGTSAEAGSDAVLIFGQ
jgi:hypothetical protein